MSKTEKEKMLDGELFLSTDTELVREKQAAQQLLYQFNHSSPDAIEKRQQLLKELLTINGSAKILPPFQCVFGYNIEIGNGFFANYDCLMLDCHKVIIGDRVLFGPRVQIHTVFHHLSPSKRHETYAKPVRIGNDVWVGAGAILLPGITIGDGAVIGAGSIVTRDIPAGVLAVGNPCCVRKQIDQQEHYQ